MELDKQKAIEVVDKIAKKFDYTIEEAANAITRVANANMCDALRLISVRRGYDPRDFALVAFGGAGPLHGAYLAKEMEIPTVIIPPHPGVAAAMGCLLVDVRHDISKTYVKNVKDVSLKDLEKEFIGMEKEAAELLQEEGVAKEASTLMRYIDMRYMDSGVHWRLKSIARFLHWKRPLAVSIKSMNGNFLSPIKNRPWKSTGFCYGYWNCAKT